MIIAENVFSQPSLSALKILGIDSTIFMYIVCILFVVGIIVWYFLQPSLQHKKNMKRVEGQVLCYFKEKEGRGTFELCPINNGKIQSKIKGATEDYYALPGHSDGVDFPIGRPKSQQVQVPIYFFYRNIAAPQFPSDINKWNPDYVIKMTSAMANITADDSNMKVLAEEQRSEFADIDRIHNYLKKIPLLLYAVLGLIGLSVVNLIFLFQVSGGISTVVKFLVGK